MTTLLVDWLGRGGIAQTTEAWARELAAAGTDVVVVTREGRELAAAPVPVVTVPAGRGRIATHRDLATAAARAIEEHRPGVAVVANYVIPPLELPVYEAARRPGARVVLVVHDHRLHTRLAGTWVGMRRLVRGADVVVAHTRFVAKGIAHRYGREDVVLVPHPLPLGLLAAARPEVPPLADGPEALALHFGVLHRRYKGTGTVLALANPGVAGWRFALVGEGAPRQASHSHRPGPVRGLMAAGRFAGRSGAGPGAGRSGREAPPTGMFGTGPNASAAGPYGTNQEGPRAQVIRGFLEAGVLVAAVEQSAATLLPYSVATQSGAIVLAQALGSVPVASAVGGIPDQIDDGVDGRLVAAGAPTRAWAAVLGELADPDRRDALAAAGRRRVTENHRRFTEAIKELAS